MEREKDIERGELSEGKTTFAIIDKDAFKHLYKHYKLIETQVT